MRGRWAAGLLAAAAVLLACAPGAAARDVIVTSFDGTPIAAHFFGAENLPAGGRAATVLVGHGWGQEGDDDPNSSTLEPFGAIGLGPLRRAGFNVLTWDARGFGQSGGEAKVDSADFEGRDVQALIDWLAEQPEALLDAAGDPRVGMAGVSYGGGIQLVTAGIDRRVDAITPTIAWNSLTRSLYRDAAVKQGWGLILGGAAATTLTGGLVAPGGLANGTVDPQVTQALIEGTAGGSFSQATVDFFEARDIDRVAAGIRVPTLLLQGTADTLFTPREAMDNWSSLAAGGVPRKMIWFCGGHGACLSGSGPSGRVEGAIVAWLRRHLAGDTGVDTGPAFEWIADDGRWRSAGGFPLAPLEPLRGRGSGVLPISPGSPASGGGALIAASPAVDAVNVSIPAPAREAEVVGEPRVRITYSGSAVPQRTFLFAQVLDARSGRVLGNQVTPIPVTLDGSRRTVERPLEPIAAHLGPASRYKVQVAAGTAVYGLQRSAGAVTLSAVEAELPVVDPAATPAVAAARAVRAVRVRR
jgi:ABC-2 type transport system ATP-binding protein